jgi:predicted PhzF superfamily epimerase YddE/YHI9
LNITKLRWQGLIISSTSNQYDFVSRYFCPKYGINEDPVTGSAHTTLIPYWAENLNKSI